MTKTEDIYQYTPGTNQLFEITGSSPLSFSYNGNGNVTNMGEKTLVYHNNRMEKVLINETVVADYTYNALGQRIKKTDGNTTIYHYDHQGNLISENQGSRYIDYVYLGNIRLAMVTSNGTLCQGDFDEDNDVDGTDLAVFLSHYGRTDCATSPCKGDFNNDGKVDSPGLDTPAGCLERVDCPEADIYYYHNDHLGTPQVMTDENGTIVWNADYKPFGKAEIDPASTIVNHFRLPGQYYDEETGLHYNYYRYYAPEVGRYLRGDPIGLDGGINLYVYAVNNPVNWVDPEGLYSFQQGLQDTATYSGIAATASFLTPGGQTAFIVFAGFGVGVKSLEIVLYSQGPYIDALRESVKMILPVKKPYDMFTDDLLDLIIKVVKEIEYEKPCKKKK